MIAVFGQAPFLPYPLLYPLLLAMAMAIALLVVAWIRRHEETEGYSDTLEERLADALEELKEKNSLIAELQRRVGEPPLATRTT